MATGSLNKSNASPTNATIWTPPLSPKDQQRIDQQRKRSRRNSHSWFAAHGFSNRTLREHLEFFAVLALPVILTLGTIWLTNVQSQAVANATAAQSQAAARASAQQHQTDLDLAQDQQQETALQTYLDRMSDLLFTEHLATSRPGDEVRQVARARTLTLLPHLNSTRKGEVIQFLYEANLLEGTQKGERIGPIVDLSGANLSGANLSGADLSFANLSGAHGTTFQQLNAAASLSGTIMPD